jgi:hypothetical protein
MIMPDFPAPVPTIAHRSVLVKINGIGVFARATGLSIGGHRDHFCLKHFLVEVIFMCDEDGRASSIDGKLVVFRYAGDKDEIPTGPNSGFWLPFEWIEAPEATRSELIGAFLTRPPGRHLGRANWDARLK